MPGPGETAGGTDWVKFRPPRPTGDCWGIFYTFSSLMKQILAAGCCYRQAVNRKRAQIVDFVSGGLGVLNLFLSTSGAFYQNL